MRSKVALLVILFFVSGLSVHAQIFEQSIHSADSAAAEYDLVTREKCLEKALEVAPARLRDSVSIELAETYTQNWKFDKAKKVLAGISPSVSNLRLQMIAQRCKAMNLIYYEEFDSAANLFHEVNKLSAESGAAYQFQRAENLLALARYYRIYGKTDSTLYCALEAVRIFRQDTAHYDPSYRLALATASNVYLSQVDIVTSSKYNVQSNRGLTKKKIRHPAYLESRLMGCQVYTMRGDVKTANETYAIIDSIATVNYGTKNAFIAFCHNNRGMEAMSNLDFKHADSYLLSSLSVLKDIDMSGSMMYAMTLNNIGLNYVNLEQWRLADSIFRIASELATKKWGAEYYLNGLIAYNQAYSYIGQKEYFKAGRELIKGGKICQSQLLKDVGGLSEKGQIGVYNLSEPYFQVLPSFKHLYPEYADDSINIALVNEQLLYKGLIAYNQSLLFRDIRKGVAEQLRKPFEGWLSNRHLLSSYYSLGKSRAFLDSLNNTITVQERYLQGSLATEPEVEKVAGGNFRAVAAKLKPGEVAIEFVKYRLFRRLFSDSIFYAALIIKPGDASPAFVDLADENTLFKVIRPRYSGDTVLNNLGSIYRDQRLVKRGQKTGADSLYNWLWKPLEKFVAGSKRIYYSPIGILNAIAFTALPDENDKLLIDKHELIRYQRLADLKNEEELAAKDIQAAWLWGGVAYGTEKGNNAVASKTRSAGTDKKDWKQLDYTGQETQAIGQVFSKLPVTIKTFKGREASRENFLAMSIDKPSVLHISTHGFYDRDSTEQPVSAFNVWSYNTVKTFSPLLRTGLVLAGANELTASDSSEPAKSAMLTSYDVASMDLRNVKLATLSACETAMGDIENGDGVFGLQRALRQAGVGKMILSLWPVYDAQTSAFMTSFYQRLAGGGRIRDAFRDTQKEFSRKSAPIFWAGFVLVE